ncbi:hypothetical protein ABK040_004307 [Willaertia magna]
MSLMELPTDCLRIILYFCDSLTIVNLKKLNKNLFEFIDEIKDELNIFYFKGYLSIQVLFSKIFNFGFVQEYLIVENLIYKLKKKFPSLLNEEDEIILEFCNFVKDGNSLQNQKEKLKNKIYSKCQTNLQKENLKYFFNWCEQLTTYQVVGSKQIENYNLQNLEFTSINRFKVILFLNKKFTDIFLNFATFMRSYLGDEHNIRTNTLDCSLPESREGSLFSFLFNNNTLQKTNNTVEKDYNNFIDSNLNLDNLLLIIKYYTLTLLPNFSLHCLLYYNKVNSEFVYNLKKEKATLNLPTTNVTIPKNMMNGDFNFMLNNFENFRKVYYYFGWELFSMDKKINLINKLLNNLNALYELNSEEMIAVKELGLTFERNILVEENNLIVVKFFVRTINALIWKKLIIPFRWKLKDDLQEFNYVIGLQIIKQIYLNKKLLETVNK